LAPRPESPAVAETDERVLVVEDLSAAYGARPVVADINITVGRGEIVAVLGHNGAGKTTLLKTIFGLLPPRSGRVVFGDVDATRQGVTANVVSGMSFTPAEAPVFRDLSVSANLELGAFTVRDEAAKAERMERVLSLFPILGERRDQAAGTLSGGEQRMLAIGIALMSGPRLMLLDEPSLGIAPAQVQRLLGEIHSLCKSEDLSVLLVEQNVRAALRVADRAYFMRAGRVILEEPADVALARDHWWDLF
jgi:branched-chain amino acid transport system ATP-binding protein